MNHAGLAEATVWILLGCAADWILLGYGSEVQNVKQVVLQHEIKGLWKTNTSTVSIPMVIPEIDFDVMEAPASDAYDPT